jgi:hypothetical protein
LVEGIIMNWPHLTEQKQPWLYLYHIALLWWLNKLKKHIMMLTLSCVLNSKKHGMSFQSQIYSILFWALTLNHR